jgi:hypothetical protein
MFGLRRSRQKGRNWAGATPKGQGRPVRPTTAGGRQTPFPTWRPREATREFGQLGRALVRRGIRQMGKKWAGTTPKGQGRPVRPKTAGGRLTPFPTRRPQEAAREFKQLGIVFGSRNGVGDTPKGQRRTGRPHDSWRTPTPFWTGKL